VRLYTRCPVCDEQVVVEHDGRVPADPILRCTQGHETGRLLRFDGGFRPVRIDCDEKDSDPP
jgi:hypothetical protein